MFQLADSPRARAPGRVRRGFPRHGGRRLHYHGVLRTESFCSSKRWPRSGRDRSRPRGQPPLRSMPAPVRFHQAAKLRERGKTVAAAPVSWAKRDLASRSRFGIINSQRLLKMGSRLGDIALNEACQSQVATGDRGFGRASFQSLLHAGRLRPSPARWLSSPRFKLTEPTARNR